MAGDLPPVPPRRRRVRRWFGVAVAVLCLAVVTGWGTARAAAPAGPPGADSFFGNLLKVYMPRQSCMYHEWPLIWLHVVSDAVIALAYYSIPVALVLFVRRRRDLAFGWMFLCFAAFIVSCGATHVLAVLAIWYPVYRLDGIVKAITAVASVGTAIALWPLLSKAMALPSPAELRSANRELEAFSYSVAHDLRAPLRSLDGFSQAVLEDYADQLDATGEDYLRRIRAASQRMGVLIDDLLSLSRLSRVEMRRQRTDLTRIAHEVAQELRDAAPGRAVRLTVADGLVAHADPGLTRAVLANLLGNAWKFTANAPGEARVEVGSETLRGERAFFVRDNGAGFDRGGADKLFGAFQRFHAAADFPGTGIGLATVQRIVHRHGGRVWADSAPGAGAAFHFTL
jgi:signal transduction histidine kinase